MLLRIVVYVITNKNNFPFLEIRETFTNWGISNYENTLLQVKPSITNKSVMLLQIGSSITNWGKVYCVLRHNAASRSLAYKATPPSRHLLVQNYQ